MGIKLMHKYETIWIFPYKPIRENKTSFPLLSGGFLKIDPVCIMLPLFVAEFIKTVLSKTPEIALYIDSNINIY